MLYFVVFRQSKVKKINAADYYKNVNKAQGTYKKACIQMSDFITQNYKCYVNKNKSHILCEKELLER